MRSQWVIEIQLQTRQNNNVFLACRWTTFGFGNVERNAIGGLAF